MTIPRALLLALAAAAPLRAQAPRAPAIEQDELVRRLSRTLDSLASAGTFAGAVALQRDGAMVFAHAYGPADRATSRPNTLGTAFNIGSINKVFTATAIRQLAAAGRLSLDSTLGTYWPDYPNPPARAASIRQLMEHQAGLGGNIFDAPPGGTRHDIQHNNDYLQLFAKEPLAFPPGSGRRYCNVCYVVLGMLVDAQNATRELTKLLLDQTILEKKIKKLKPSLAQAILNAPMLDFIKPSLQIQQIVVENLYDDFYFSKAQKVDRCITCHLGIDQKGFENAPAPFKSHPRLDLFLSSNSPHPMEKFGCTVCHSGSGQSLTFTTASHTPQNEAQAKDWSKKYHWHEMESWTDKMLPTNHVEAACAKCHQGTVEVPQAPKLNEGRQLAQTYGCYACHKVQGFDRWKVGPSLMHVQSKLEPDWIVRWLQNPKEFRSLTKMPRIFHLSNTSDPASVEKSNTAIAGIAAYLMKNSDPITLTSPPVKGDPAVGEKLVKTLGCAGCHTVAGQAANNYGPELSGLGSKVKAEWLYTWLKNPKAYHPETRMPNLRLSDEEASHITAYLLSLRNEKFESIRPPLVKPEAVDDLALNYLIGTMRQEDAKAEIAKMNPDQKLELIGKKAIAHQGCFGCHEIKGFETTKPIGTELTEEGSKDIHKLYFGFVNIEDTRQAWFFQKLKEPRSFDKGKELPYLEKLRMPQFDFTDAQAEALVTFLLSLQKAQIPLEMHKNLTVPEQQIEAGRLLVAKFNCNGCHTLDGKEGRARQLFEDKGNAPPIINGEGKKVQSAWLYHFLQGPTPIRPWLKYRMPTFGFSDENLTTIVQYFNSMDKVSQVYLEGKKPEATEEEIEAGHQVFQKFQCIKCHKSNPETKLSSSFLAPNLVMAKNRLRPEWVVEWLKDPQALMEGTMMPGFFADGQTPFQELLGGDALKQMQAIRDYIWQFTPEEAAELQAAAAAPPTPAAIKK